MPHGCRLGLPGPGACGAFWGAGVSGTLVPDSAINHWFSTQAARQSHSVPRFPQAGQPNPNLFHSLWNLNLGAGTSVILLQAQHREAPSTPAPCGC